MPAATRRYGRSKRANILFAMELDRRLRAPPPPGGGGSGSGCTGVRVNVCHPGTIGATGLGDGVFIYFPSLLYYNTIIIIPFGLYYTPLLINGWMDVLLAYLRHDDLDVGTHTKTHHRRRYYPA